MAARIVRMGKGKPTPYDGLVRLTARGEPAWTGEIAFDSEKLATPLRWKKPRRVFVNSMSDLFHENLSDEQIAAVFGVMAACPQHTFQCLTKRSKRMREWFAWLAARVEADAVGWSSRECGVTIDAARDACVLESLDETATAALAGHFDACHLGITTNNNITWPLPNVHLGVSVENQDAADERIPHLLATPAAVRFLSCEPLLGPINLQYAAFNGADSLQSLSGLNWIIAGCESGPGARPCDVDWLRSLRDQCNTAGLPFFLKQAVRSPITYGTCGIRLRNFEDITEGPGSKRKPGGVIELPYLDGKQHKAFPVIR